MAPLCLRLQQVMEIMANYLEKLVQLVSLKYIRGEFFQFSIFKSNTSVAVDLVYQKPFEQYQTAHTSMREVPLILNDGHNNWDGLQL